MRMLPPRLVLILLVAMGALHVLLPGRTLLTFPYTLIGAAVAALGIVLTLSGANLFARVGTNIKTFNEPGTLVTDGPFRWSRNPMYLGFLLLLTGVAIVLGTVTPLIAPALFALIADRWYIAFEERAMREKFGASYEGYMGRTRRWL
jgi:protein-S-isoprenylcysteine O-methyltransferase Ste14